jgi:phosphoserine phosphatase RsbU/P
MTHLVWVTSFVLISLRCFGGASLQDQALAILRGQIIEIISGTVFVFLGLAACGIAVMRRRSGVRVFVWLGIWSAMYGALRLMDPLATVAHLPNWFRVSATYLDTVIMALMLVVATRAWLELSRGKLRPILQALIYAGLVVGLSAIGLFVFTGSSGKWMPLMNSLLATCSLCLLTAVIAVPRLAHKLLITPDSGVLLAGTLVFGLEALFTNVLRLFGYQFSAPWDSLGFAALLFSFGYVALQMVFASERRLLAIENELAIAREIQTSILPRSNPEIRNLRITAAYHPMTAVAGDFYDFIPVDQHRVGVLIADVSGHGVPAALIAAMIKMAVQSIVPCVHSPEGVLLGLNRMLSGQAPDQFVTAAYLFIDTQNYTARYSAAGHPPLLLSRAGTLHRIESNGLVFGVTAQPDYPVRDIPICPGDRLLLYTDGVIEPENAKGKPFGDSKLEQVVLGAQMCPPSELTNRLLTEIRAWRPPSMAQQDDITLVVIDVS